MCIRVYRDPTKNEERAEIRGEKGERESSKKGGSMGHARGLLSTNEKDGGEQRERGHLSA